MITEEQFRQLSEDVDPMAAALLGMNVTVRREVYQERARMNEIEDIESLKKQIDEKNREIVDLRKAVETLEEQNQELTVALKSRNEEIKVLKRESVDLKMIRRNWRTSCNLLKSKLVAWRTTSKN